MNEAIERRSLARRPAVALGLIIAAGCGISLLSFGLRSVFGLFNVPMTDSFGWSREVFAVALAIQNILWGIGQPIGGVLVDRYGPLWVFVGGGLLYVAGLLLMAFATSPIELHLTAGVLVGLGMGGASYITVLAALSKIVAPEFRSSVLGLGTAAGSLGQFLVVPLGQAFISAYGWEFTLVLLALLGLLMPILGFAFVRAGNLTPAVEDGPELSFGATLALAAKHPSYLLLTTAFFVCGFQLAFITIHMPAYLADKGADPALAAWAIGLVGLFNIVGAYAAGILGQTRSRKILLAWIYIGRSAAMTLFVLMPPSALSILLFGAMMGILWLSTAPLTSGLVALMFGTRYMATLFGIVFLSHQVGSFLGVWLGGVLFSLTGGYEITWWLGIGLGLVAAALHLPIRERPVPHPALAVAA